MNDPRKALIIVGTTASGKSSLAIALAKKYNGEVISADSRQVYKGFDISSGKVTKKEMQRVPHHLLDVASPKKQFSAADFKLLGQKAMQDIWDRGKLPIIAGGTGFYIDSLLEINTLANVPSDEKLRAQLEKKTAKQLFAQLKKLDAKRAAELQKKNEQNLKRRIIRSIEVAKGFSALDARSHLANEFDVLWIGLKWDDVSLRKRIHDRLITRLKAGMAAEVKRLHEKGLSWKRMEELGLDHRYVSRFLRGELSKEELIEQLAQKEWQYARRQKTWFRRNKKIRWFAPGKTKRIEKLVEKFLK